MLEDGGEGIWRREDMLRGRTKNERTVWMSYGGTGNPKPLCPTYIVFRWPPGTSTLSNSTHVSRPSTIAFPYSRPSSRSLIRSPPCLLPLPLTRTPPIHYYNNRPPPPPALTPQRSTLTVVPYHTYHTTLCYDSHSGLYSTTSTITYPSLVAHAFFLARSHATLHIKPLAPCSLTSHLTSRLHSHTDTRPSPLNTAHGRFLSFFVNFSSSIVVHVHAYAYVFLYLDAQERSRD